MAGPAPTILAMGSALVVAFLASAIFRKTHVPDILFLLLTGAVMGPALRLLDLAALHDALPFLSALAVITILFDGALEVTPRHLAAFGWPSIRLSLTVLTLTTLACAVVAHTFAHLDWMISLLLGLCFGGAGIAIIVPLARRMDVSGNAMTVILLEAVTSDVVVIIGMFVACTAVARGAVDLPVILDLALGLALGAIVGPLTGWGWSKFLARWGAAANAYTATLAVLLLVYAGTETLKGSGPLAVLLFGIVVGNARGHGLTGRLRTRVFGADLIAFHHEIVFFVRAAFFVALGAVARWDLLAHRDFLVTGLLLGLTVGVCRAVGVTLVMGRNPGLGGWDKVTTGVLFPMGLATAAVSIVPRNFGIRGGDVIADYAAVVIVLTNILGTLAIFGASSLRRRRVAVAGRLPDVEAAP